MYVGGIVGAFMISFFDGLHNANLEIAALTPILNKIPLYSVGIGWFVPALVGIVIGYVISLFQKQEVAVENREKRLSMKESLFCKKPHIRKFRYLKFYT